MGTRIMLKHVLLAAVLTAASAIGEDPARSDSFDSDLALATQASQAARQEKVVASIIGAVNKLGADAAAKQSHTNARLRADEAKMQRIMKDDNAEVKVEEQEMDSGNFNPVGKGGSEQEEEQEEEEEEEEDTALLTINKSDWPNLSAAKSALKAAENAGGIEEDDAEDAVFRAQQKQDAADREEKKAARAEAKTNLESDKASHAVDVMTESTSHPLSSKRATKKQPLPIIHQQEDEKTKDEDVETDHLHSHKSEKKASPMLQGLKADLLKHPQQAESRFKKLKLAMATAIKEEDHEVDEDEKAEEEAEDSKGTAAEESSEARDKEWAAETEIHHQLQEGAETETDLLKDVIKDPQQDEATIRAAVATLVQGE